MASRATKVRLVRCPKCRRVLPELADVPVYQCGGCGATLKAKNRKENRESFSSEALENYSAQKNELDHDSESKQLTWSSRKAIFYSTEECNQFESGNFEKEQSGSRTSNEFSSSSELNCHEKEESLFEAEANRKADESSGRGSNFGTSPDIQLVSGGSSLGLADQRASGDSIPSGTNNFSLNEQLEIPQEIVCCDSDHLRSRNTLETTEPTDNSIVSEEDMVETELSEELGDVKPSGGLENISKSPTTRSFNAYDGSVSSYDGLDVHISDQHLQLPKRTSFESQRVAEFVSSKEWSTRGEVPVNDKVITNSDVQHQAKMFSSMSLNEMPSPVTMGSVYRGQDELLHTTRYAAQAELRVNSHGSDSFHSAQSWIGSERDEFLWKDPFYRRGTSAGSENGGPSNYRQESQWSSNLYASDKLDYVERNQMELLRKVDELRDQLNKSYAHREKVNGRFPIRGAQQDKQWPLYYNHKVSSQEVLRGYDVNYPRHSPGEYRPRRSMTHQCSSSQMSFSGEARNRRHRHSDYSCSHSYHEDCQCLQKLLPCEIYNEGLYRACPGHMCYNPYSSNSSSPQHYLHSNFLHWDHEIHRQPHDQRHINHEARIYHKDRHLPMKRHCLPIAGGAPFIICYRCRKLLQIPADFLLSSRRCHRLQCSSCCEILMFSLNKRTHIVPYSLNSTVPPPTEVDNVSAATSTTNLASTSHANGCLQGDSVSYSEDYNSGSTEGEPAFLMPAFPYLKSNAINKQQPPSNYAEPMEERKKKPILKQSGNKHKLSTEASISARVISNEVKLEKSSSRAEMRSTETGSPLHRLLGYSSPSEMINGPCAEIDS